ncbi:MAG: DNA recombination protein RmuC [Saprospirales bacterium]|jgi:DNA recombination protein RmuC|nr:DNA recombination protein RmuC [Saprospirales bacterium]
MEYSETLLLPLLIGLLLGGLIVWLYTKLSLSSRYISRGELEKSHVSKEQHQAVQEQLAQSRQALQQTNEQLLVAERELAARKSDLRHMQEKLDTWELQMAELQKQSKLEFENLANRILEEKSKKFTNENQKQLNDILNPLRERIREFGQDIEKRFSEEAKDVVSLKKEIEHLKELNQQVSSDARNLALALKGDSKTQGDWGEMQLERLLEAAGLQKGIHFATQDTYKTDDGKNVRPDFIIHLPEGKNLVIDCKVSLTAYERYFNEEDENKKAKHLLTHLDSLRKHVKGLAAKNYQQLYQINSPDYVLLFVPIEPAFITAVQNDLGLFQFGLDNNIVLVSPSTLLATMRTVSFIWKQDDQRKNVDKIARESGKLYDKLVAFIEDLKELGQRMDQAQRAYTAAMNKLNNSSRFGDTVVGRAQRIKDLGAKTTKNMPPELLKTADEEEIN